MRWTRFSKVSFRRPRRAPADLARERTANTAARHVVVVTQAPAGATPAVMCNAYNLRHRNEAILDIARAMQLSLADLPEFPPRHRIGIKQRGLILRPERRWPAGLVLGALEPGAARRQGAAGLPAEQRPRRTSSARGRGRPSSASAA